MESVFYIRKAVGFLFLNMPSLPFDSNESVEPTYKAVSENGVEDLKKYFRAEDCISSSIDI
jgi:hypothetical protein